MKPKIKPSCRNCANPYENPEQCYDCKLNDELTNRWRPFGSAGFTRDSKPLIYLKKSPKNKIPV